MSWGYPDCFLPFNYMRELVENAPQLIQVSSQHVSNWMVSTALGTKLYSEYEPHIELTVPDVLEIVCLSLMALDPETLHRFCPSGVNDMATVRFSVFTSSFFNRSDDTAEACLHYTDFACRRVVLVKNASDLWEVTNIGLLTEWTAPSAICPYCSV